MRRIHENTSHINELGEIARSCRKIFIIIKQTINMKKIFIVSAMIILILAIIIGVVYFYMNQKPDISGLPDYYKNLAKECESKQSYSCCIASVNSMAARNYQLTPETGCPEGYQPNGLECIDSFSWCQPIQKVSECEKSGGKENNLTECNGEINKICTLPNGETCYLENFRNGRCEGIFTPKVVCDKYQSNLNEPDETANWKTYRNEKYGFEVKYPKEYSIQLGEEVNLGCFFFTTETDPYYRFNYSICVSDAQFNIEKQTREKILSVESPCNITFKSTRINNTDALRVSYSRWDCSKKDSLWTQIKYNNNLYSIKWFMNYSVFSEDEMFKTDGYEKYNQILSTFKFTK